MDTILSELKVGTFGRRWLFALKLAMPKKSDGRFSLMWSGCFKSSFKGRCWNIFRRLNTTYRSPIYQPHVRQPYSDPTSITFVDLTSCLFYLSTSVRLSVPDTPVSLLNCILHFHPIGTDTCVFLVFDNVPYLAKSLEASLSKNWPPSQHW